MTQYNTFNVKLSTSQLNKLKSGIKNGTEVTLKILSNVVHDSNDEKNFLHRSLLTNTQFSKLPKAFANNSSANVKLSKTQLHKIEQSGRFLGRLLGPLLKTGFLLIGNVLKPLDKSVLIPLWLRATASATHAAIHDKIFGSVITTLIISEEMSDIMKIVKFLEEIGFLIIGVSETIRNEAKEQKGGFLSMLLGALGATLLGNLLTGKGVIATSQGCKWLETLATQANISGRSTIRAGEGTIRTGQDF